MSSSDQQSPCVLSNNQTSMNRRRVPCPPASTSASPGAPHVALCESPSTGPTTACVPSSWYRGAMGGRAPPNCSKVAESTTAAIVALASGLGQTPNSKILTFLPRTSPGGSWIMDEAPGYKQQTSNLIPNQNPKARCTLQSALVDQTGAEAGGGTGRGRADSVIYTALLVEDTKVGEVGLAPLHSFSSCPLVHPTASASPCILVRRLLSCGFVVHC
jgi:hypothetical protein